MPQTTTIQPSLSLPEWWSPIFGALTIIVPLFFLMEKHLVQRCSPCNSLALQYLREPGKWGHAYLPMFVTYTAVEVYGQPVSSMAVNFPDNIVTADSITLYGRGLLQAICAFAIQEVIDKMKVPVEQYPSHLLILALHDIENDRYPGLLDKIRSCMKAVIAIYEAHSEQGDMLVPDGWRSTWTDEFGHLLVLSRPLRYNRNDVENWVAACVFAGGGEARRVDQRLTIRWRGKEHCIDEVHWWFEQVGYAPANEWLHPAMFILAAAETAKNGGLVSANVVFTIERHHDFRYSDHRTLTRVITEVVAQDFHAMLEVEPASELIAGVTLLFVGKIAISVFCALVTGGGPWLVAWLTTALSRWSVRDLGGMRQGRWCNGAGYHVHTGDCRLRFLSTTCLTSGGSDHSRILGVLTALCGWSMARIVYGQFPRVRLLLETESWANTNGFAVNATSLAFVCTIALMTISYKPPRTSKQRYYIYRIALEWGFAILAVCVSMLPVMIAGEVRTAWMLLAEVAAWIIDGGMTLRVIGTYPNSITTCHSIWVLVPALLSAMGGIFGCWT